MKWFDRWFVRKCKWAWDNRDFADIAEQPTPAGHILGSGRSVPVEVEETWSDGLRINVRKVIGGSVVSFRTYDRIKDRSDERHYIITDEQEFDRELGKIITMESMRQT